LPKGAKWTVKVSGPRELQIVLTGMPPGEALAFKFIASPLPGHSREIIITPRETVDADGRFVLVETGFEPLPGTVINTWQIEMTHSTGMACAEVTFA
jgi:hypothetical protein